jgi:hypothetical protein
VPAAVATLSRVRIVLHAGLHKSGTTSIQAGWKNAYGDNQEVWYPPPPPGPPGHHRLLRPMVRAFVDGLSPDLVRASVAFHAQPRRRQTLADVVAQARARGVETLLLSSENLDRAREEDRSGLRSALGDHEVTVVLTVTQPVHRWCSGWQTLVRHGLAEYPADALRHVVEFAALRPGRLEELTTLVPGATSVVRLVRHSPVEPDLAADLAAALGFPEADRAASAAVLNPSLGTDTEVVLRINRADLALGTDRQGKALLARLRREGFTYRDAPELAERYAIPALVHEYAAAEASWLRATVSSDGEPTVLDPHGCLETWTDPSVSEWYDTVSRREAILPGLDEAAADRETQLWRVRQQRSAYWKRLEQLAAPPSGG